MMKATMKAAQVHQFLNESPEHWKTSEQLKDNISLADNIEIPNIDQMKKSILIQVAACSLSPGDVIMAQGSVVFLHPPKFPYIPGMDVVGRVRAVSPDLRDAANQTFPLESLVVASNGMTPVGGLAECMIIPASEAVLLPVGDGRRAISVEQAAASSSAVTALQAVCSGAGLTRLKNLDKTSLKGKRILVLGGSGGVGSAALAWARWAGASFVATTSTQADLCQGQGAHQVLDYRTQDWWTCDDFQKQPFDVIIDTVGGHNHWDKACKSGVLKSRRQGGRFVAVTGDRPQPDMGTAWKALGFFLSLPWRPLKTKLRPGKFPAYELLFPRDVPLGRQMVLKAMADGSLNIVLDSCHPFTEEGITSAFGIVSSGRAHGKVVVKIP